MKTSILIALSFIILSIASCVIAGGSAKTRVHNYAETDSLSIMTVPDSVELYFKGDNPPKFAYDKIARITITGAKNDNSAHLIQLLSEKAKELYCDASVFVEFDNVERHYGTLNPFWKGESETISVLEITGLAIRKRFSITDSIP